jgi:hypothetical protein
MSKEAVFFIYLIERYAEAKKSTARNVLELWDSLNLTDFIFEMHEMYHVERLENAFDDIDELILEKQRNIT